MSTSFDGSRRPLLSKEQPKLAAMSRPRVLAKNFCSFAHLAAELGAAMTKADLECNLDGHEFPGIHPHNVCNRGRRGVGVQLELSATFRESSLHKRKLVAAVREVRLRRVARRTRLGAAKPSV